MKVKNKRYIFIQNLITPYRNYLFCELKKRNLDFDVFYMGISESDRNWNIDITSLKYDFWIDKSGFYSYIRGFHIHFNPVLIWKLINCKGNDIILSVSWNDINIIILAILKKLKILKNTIHFWTEANYLTIGASNDNKFKYKLRKFVYSSVDGSFIIPGKMAKDTLNIWGVSVNKFVLLPNIIEEESYQVSDSIKDKRLQNKLPVFILPARLIETFKGILNFFKAIGVDNIRKGQFLIAGEGPDRKIYEEFIQINGLNDNIKLLGFCNINEMKELYSQANVFLLPSFSDQSPLTLIEAIRMKLPILVSNRCGNHFETLLENKNGYSFDPYDKNSILEAYEKILINKDCWTDFGEVSDELYKSNFKIENTLNKFISEFKNFK